MTKKLPPKQRPLPPVRPVSPDDLDLDASNPRLASTDLKQKDQVEILRVLWREMAVSELVDSIAENGYWGHEEIFATKEGGRLVVIEGNRRVAAIKLLLDENLVREIGARGIPPTSQLKKEVRDSISQLPVIECSRTDIWQYLGFKHVNGPQDWDSVAKAQYISRVHTELGIDLRDIARTIGDKHNTVVRLYRGWTVLSQAEKAGVFDRDDIWNPRFAYSHLWVGLTYPNIQAFIGLDPEKIDKKELVPKTNLEELGELLLWLYGSKERNEPPVIKSQNPDLRKLEEAVSSRNGIAALRRKYPLDVAVNASRGDQRLFREALVAAERALRECKGYVSTGYEGESDLLKSAENIETLAATILEEMSRYSNNQTATSKRRSRK